MAITGKTVIITGASQGIGAAITKLCLERGYRVRRIRAAAAWLLVPVSAAALARGSPIGRCVACRKGETSLATESLNLATTLVFSRVARIISRSSQS